MDIGGQHSYFINCSAHFGLPQGLEFQKLMALLFSPKIMVLLNGCWKLGFEGNASNDS